MKIAASHILKFIEQEFAAAQGQYELAEDWVATVATLVDLLDHFEHINLVADPDLQFRFIQARSALRIRAELWKADRKGKLKNVRGRLNTSPIEDLIEVLKLCEDRDILEEDSGGFSFVRSDSLRKGLQQDLTEVRVAANAGQWKAATVLGGSLLEALLVDFLLRHSSSNDHQKILNMRLQELLSFTRSRFKNLIEEPAASQQVEPVLKICDSLRAFRNLIHPAQMQRQKTVCDEATALAALAAVLGLQRVILGLPEP